MLALSVAAPALAQDLASLNKALAAYNAGNFDDAAAGFYAVRQSTGSDDSKQKAEYYLASSLLRLQLPFAALTAFASLAEAGPAHPFHLKAVEGLVSVQEMLQEDVIIPSLLDKLYNLHAESWTTLPIETIARINYLIGRRSFRSRNLSEARQFFESVTLDTGVSMRARYMLGLTLSDPSLPVKDEAEAAANARSAVALFEGLLNDKRFDRSKQSQLQQLASVALARVRYNLGDFEAATKGYDRVPRYSKYWDQSLFENGFARFQNDDFGGALGSLQALHAPQFDGAFQPESWILKATVYYFSCLFAESEAALKAFEARYGPMLERLKTINGATDKELTWYLGLLDEKNGPIPSPVRNAILNSERLVNLLATLKQLEREKAAISSRTRWSTSALGPELLGALKPNQALLEQLAGREVQRELKEAAATIRGFVDQSEIIRFEMAKSEKEFAERGDNVAAILKAQRIGRPRMPGEHFQYWKFQGEFWRDEIGYYQYTLKNACPLNETNGRQGP